MTLQNERRCFHFARCRMSHSKLELILDQFSKLQNVVKIFYFALIHLSVARHEQTKQNKCEQGFTHHRNEMMIQNDQHT